MRNLVYFGYGNWMNDSVCDIESLAPEWMKWFLCLYMSHVYRPHIEWLLFQGGCLIDNTLNGPYNNSVVYPNYCGHGPFQFTNAAWKSESLKYHLPDWMALLHGHLTVCGTHTPGQ